MRPVDQRRSRPEEPIGDCFSACIASILEVPLADVPVFSALPAARDGTWIHAVNDWLRIRGYCIAAYDAAYAQGPSPECFHIASGPHPDMPEDGPGHAVVVYGDRLIHDPNNRRRGITEIRHRWLLVPTDWRHVKTPVLSPVGPWLHAHPTFVVAAVAGILWALVGLILWSL